MNKLAAIFTLVLVSQVLSDTRIDLALSGRDLPDDDFWGDPPDPYAVVFYSPTESDSYSRMGKTSTIDNSYNPVWTESFTFFAFSTSYRQRVKIEIWDQDWSNADDFMGSIEFSLIDIINTPGNRLELNMGQQGTIVLSGRINATRTM